MVAHRSFLGCDFRTVLLGEIVKHDTVTSAHIVIDAVDVLTKLHEFSSSGIIHSSAHGCHQLTQETSLKFRRVPEDVDYDNTLPLSFVP